MKKKVRHVKILARCGMLQNPHQQLPESGAAACCGMLLPLMLAHEPADITEWKTLVFWQFADIQSNLFLVGSLCIVCYYYYYYYYYY